MAEKRSWGQTTSGRFTCAFFELVSFCTSREFFWAKTDALKPLFDREFRIEDFPEEQGQTDGTLAHVIERSTSLISKNRGYHDAIVDYEEGIIRIDAMF